MRRIAVPLMLLSFAGLPLLAGCEDTVHEERQVEVKDDGTVVKEETAVTEQADGTIEKTETKEVDTPPAR